MSFKQALWLGAWTLAASWGGLAVAQAQGESHGYVVAVDFSTKPENFSRFKQMMNENAKASVTEEPGCREFNIYEVAASPNHLFLYEVYEDEAAFKQHMASAHYKHFDQVSAPIASHVATHGTIFAAYHKH